MWMPRENMFFTNQDSNSRLNKGLESQIVYVCGAGGVVVTHCSYTRPIGTEFKVSKIRNPLFDYTPCERILGRENMRTAISRLMPMC